MGNYLEEYYRTFPTKYKVDLSLSTGVPEIGRFRQAANNLFCHACGLHPELDELLTDIADVLQNLCVPVGRDAFKESGRLKGKPRPASTAIGPLSAAADACAVLFTMARKRDLTKEDLKALKTFEKANEQAKGLLDRERLENAQQDPQYDINNNQ